MLLAELFLSSSAALAFPPLLGVVLDVHQQLELALDVCVFETSSQIMFGCVNSTASC